MNGTYREVETSEILALALVVCLLIAVVDLLAMITYNISHRPLIYLVGERQPHEYNIFIGNRGCFARLDEKWWFNADGRVDLNTHPGVKQNIHGVGDKLVLLYHRSGTKPECDQAWNGRMIFMRVGFYKCTYLDCVLNRHARMHWETQSFIVKYV